MTRVVRVRKGAMSADVKRVMAKAKAAARERAFLANLAALGVYVPVPEFRFHPARKWRFDYAWLMSKLALEVDGAIWTNGRHSRGSGVVKEHEKFNAAALLGWRILRVTPDQLTDPATARLVRDGLAP